MYHYFLGPIGLLTVADADMARKIMLNRKIDKQGFDKLHKPLSQYMGDNVVFVGMDKWPYVLVCY